MSVIHDEDSARQFLIKRLGCAQQTIAKLEEMLQLLADENSRQNLVSASSLERAWVRHIADSAQLLAVSRETDAAGLWLDLGSGAGFPGIVIALIEPERDIVLVESRAKRVTWLRALVDRFDLNRTTVLGSRIETVDDFPASVISARAFAPLKRLLAVSSRFSTPETLWLLPKGAKASEELSEMPKTMQKMFHVEQSLTDGDAAILVGRGRPGLKKLAR